MFSFFYPTSADEWQNVGLVLTVIAFTVAFAFAIGSAALNWKINKTKRAESRLKDEKIALEFKTKEAEIANAKKGAEEARAEAAKAKEGAELANERAQNLEHSNLILRSDLNKAAGEVAILQKDATEARTEQQKVQIALAAQQERAANAERALLELQERVKPRRLTAEQREKFISVLKQFPKVPIALYCGDPEACNFARQLVAAFRAAGWDDMQGGDGSELYAFSPPIIGIVVTRKERYPIPLQYMAVHNALNAAGISHVFGYNETIPAGLIEIKIGVKP